MRKGILLLVVISFVGCAIPYIKLSDEVSARHLIWASKLFYTVETSVKNTGERMLDLKILCEIGGEKKVYNLKIEPGRIAEIREKVSKSVGGGVSVNCEFYKR